MIDAELFVGGMVVNVTGVFTSATITAILTNVANAAREFDLWTWYDMPTNQMGPGLPNQLGE